MYSTNLQLHNDVTLFDGDGNCVGTAYGFESVTKDEDGNVTHVGLPTQTAKDNALLWSLAPEMVELLQDAVDGLSPLDFAHWQHLTRSLLAQLAHAIPPASVAADA